MKKIMVFIVLFLMVGAVYAKPIIEFDGTDWTRWTEYQKQFYIFGFVTALESVGIGLAWDSDKALRTDVDDFYKATHEYERPIWSVIALMHRRKSDRAEEG